MRFPHTLYLSLSPSLCVLLMIYFSANAIVAFKYIRPPRMSVTNLCELRLQWSSHTCLVTPNNIAAYIIAVLSIKLFRPVQFTPIKIGFRILQRQAIRPAEIRHSNEKYYDLFLFVIFSFLRSTRNCTRNRLRLKCKFKATKKNITISTLFI